MVALGGVTASAFTGRILIGWFLSYRMFQYINYKSLESILVSYPNAKLVFRLLAPRSVTNNRCGEILPYPMFAKYEKQGLQIAAEVVNPDEAAHKQAPGYQYWKDAVAKAFSHNISETLSRVPIPSHSVDYYPAPYHTTFYDNLVQLKRTGGMYVDLSWMVVNPLSLLERLESDDDVAGFAMKVVCSEHKLPPEPSRGFPRPSAYCKASTVMVFSKGHPVVMCMIEKYLDDAFLQCLRTDEASQGAFCIKAAMDSCVASTQSRNLLASHLLSSGTPYDHEYCYRREEKEAASHSSHRLTHLPPDCKWVSPDHVDRLLTAPANEAAHYTLAQQQLFLWTQAAGYATEWLVPQGNSILQQLIARNDEALRRLYRSRTDSNVDLTDYHPSPCSHYHTAHGIKAVTAGLSATTQAQRANMSCTLAYVLPGFMKSASTYIYGTIDNHPWVVPALRGFDYKEAGCYSQEFMGNETRHSDRMFCYPYIDPQLDRVVYGDGAIIYAPRKDVIHSLLRDNPHLKVLFSVRDPIERAVSIHRFDYDNLRTLSFANINECVLSALNLKIYQYWFSLAQRVVKKGQTPMEREQAREKLADKFMSDMAKMFQLIPNRMRCFRILHDSLYFPQIYHWFKASSAANVRVLDVQRLQTSKLSDEEKTAALQATPVVHDTDLRRLFTSSPYLFANASVLVVTASAAPASLSASPPSPSPPPSSPTVPLNAGDHRRNVSAKATALWAKKAREHHHGTLVPPARQLAENKLVAIDKGYLKYQWNAIFQFLGLPPVVDLVEGDKHETHAHDIPSHHLLNDTVRLHMQRFFQPFNLALVEFMDDVGRKLYD